MKGHVLAVELGRGTTYPEPEQHRLTATWLERMKRGETTVWVTSSVCGQLTYVRARDRMLKVKTDYGHLWYPMTTTDSEKERDSWMKALRKGCE